MSITTYDWYLDNHQNIFSYCFYDSIFTSDELKSIETLVKDINLDQGKVNDLVDPDTRNSRINFIPSNKEDFNFIFERCVYYTLLANQEFFNYDLEKIQTLQYTVYKEGQYYKEHADMNSQSLGKNCRKLSFSIQLSEPESYEGGDLRLNMGGKYFVAPKRIGTIIFFPSFLLHEVTPITRGERKSLVGWVLGPKWK